MSYGKFTKGARGGANTPHLLLVLDTLDEFLDEVAPVCQTIYLTATTEPPIAPVPSGSADAFCALLSARINTFNVCCHVEPLDATETDLAAQPEKTRAAIEARLSELKTLVEARDLKVRRGRWEVVA